MQSFGSRYAQIHIHLRLSTHALLLLSAWSEFSDVSARACLPLHVAHYIQLTFYSISAGNQCFIMASSQEMAPQEWPDEEPVDLLTMEHELPNVQFHLKSSHVNLDKQGWKWVKYALGKHIVSVLRF